MNLLNAVGEAIVAILGWIKNAYLGLCDLFGISEWATLSVVILIIIAIIGTNKFKTRH